MADAQRRTEEVFDSIDRPFDSINEMLEELVESDRERRYRERAHAYFGRLLRAVRVIADPELDRLLNEARDTGALDEDAIEDLHWADLVVSGRRPGEDHETYLVVEVSIALDTDDVERAARRAAALGRLRPTLAVVAGDRISDDAAMMAKIRGVWQVVVGRPVEPGSAA